MGYLLGGAVAVVLIILILSFVAPEHAEGRFWQAIQRVRAAMDAVSYWFLTGFLILSLIIAAVYGILSLLR